MLLPIMVFIFWLGVRPGPILDRVEASIELFMAPLAVESWRCRPPPDPHSGQARRVTSSPTFVVIIRDVESQ